MSAGSLIQVLGQIPRFANPNVLVGFETADDAGVFRIDEQRALVQTLDFFTPVVDDPYLFGAIAAANSLSDVYAMGGTPLTAMTIACFPDNEEMIAILAQVMRGGVEKLHEAGVALIGGHTVCDAEIKFGYAITGLVHPGKVLTNAGARPGDALILTKPLGIGIITTAIKRGKAAAGYDPKGRPRHDRAQPDCLGYRALLPLPRRYRYHRLRTPRTRLRNGRGQPGHPALSIRRHTVPSKRHSPWQKPEWCPAWSPKPGG